VKTLIACPDEPRRPATPVTWTSGTCTSVTGDGTGGGNIAWIRIGSIR
jgi:hypothetical protein